MAVYTMYKTGNYKANALWSYDKHEELIYSLETKSNGLVWIHIGNFDKSEVFTINRYSKVNEE